MWDAFDDDLGLSGDESGREGTGGWDGKGVVVRWRYVPTRSPDAAERLAAQVYYLQQRDGAADDTHALFTAEDDDLDRTQARDLLRGAQGRIVSFHRYIASPSKGLGLKTADDIQAWVRATMDGYGEHLGRELVYVASVHANTRHPHAHILIAGTGRVTTPRVRPRVTHKDVVIKQADHEAFKRLGIAAARPIAEARATMEKAVRRERQAARIAALDARLGVKDVATAAP